MRGIKTIVAPIFKKKKRTIINEEELINQITAGLWNSTSPEEVFKVSNIILGTRFSVRDHVLVSRL